MHALRVHRIECGAGCMASAARYWFEGGCRLVALGLRRSDVREGTTRRRADSDVARNSAELRGVTDVICLCSSTVLSCSSRKILISRKEALYMFA